MNNELIIEAPEGLPFLDYSVAALRTVHLDMVFMGVHGMHAKTGFTTPNLLEAETDEALVEAGHRLVVLADHTKWGVIGISSFARLDQAYVLISDTGLGAEAQAELRDRVRQLVLVDANEVAQPSVA
jgi:DeoR/GlpR family transcriptional regulator of sugar metabolism